MRCLAKSPADRPASAAILMQELQAMGLAEQWTQERARDWWAAQQPGPAAATTPTVAASAGVANADTLRQ